MRTRTIDSAFEELKNIDPNTAVSKHYIRQLIISNKIPYRKAGNKYLFDFDRLVEYLEGGNYLAVSGLSNGQEVK